MSDEKQEEIEIIKDILIEGDFRLGPFYVIEELGQGTFSVVYSGIHEQIKEEVAIKQLKKSELNNEKRLSSEINMQKKLFHPNICQMYCAIDQQHYLFLINELCPGKDILQNIIDHSYSPFSEEQACRIFQQIISGLEYMHKNLICHRDIKPENILVINPDDKNVIIKIIDFGFSRSFAGDIILTDTCCSPAYAAPEILKRKYKGDQIDIWSCGIVLYVMVYGVLPFDQNNMKDLVYHVKNGIYSLPNTISRECQDLIKKIIQVNPDKRITIQEIKNHPWMKKFNFNLMKSPGVSINEEIIPVDTDIVKEMTGKDRKKIHEVVDDIIKNRHNLNTLSYYLRVKQKIKRGEKSISDLSCNSELFLNYIKNEKSKIKYWKGDLDSRVKALEEEIFNSLEIDNKSEEIHPTNKDNMAHIKDDKIIKDIDKKENKNSNENENDINKNIFNEKISIVLFAHNILLDIINKASEKAEKKEKTLNSLKKKKININKFDQKYFMKDEQTKNNSDDNLDEQNNNKYEDFMKKQLTLYNNNNCLDNRSKNIYIKLNNEDCEESKQQIINGKKMTKIKLPTVDRQINTERKKKIIFNNIIIKGEEDINIKSSNKSKHNILNCFSIQNFISLQNKDNNIDSSEEEIPFKKHKKVKILLKDKNKIDPDPNEEVKEIEEINMDEINMNGIKTEDINFEREINKYSFQTDGSASKIEIVLKSILNDLTIIDKNDNEVNYKCQKIDDKGEKIIFNIQIVNENENSNVLTWKLENGDLNSFEELFYMIKNIFNLS